MRSAGCRGLGIDCEGLDAMGVSGDDHPVRGAGTLNRHVALHHVEQDGVGIPREGIAVAAPARRERDDALSGLQRLFTDDLRQVARRALAVDELRRRSPGPGRLPARPAGR